MSPTEKYYLEVFGSIIEFPWILNTARVISLMLNSTSTDCNRKYERLVLRK